jgi:peptidoglycan/LPS O-acetylase OafA/YrhL
MFRTHSLPLQTLHGKFESGKIHSLDGWRAISVAGVLIAHWDLSFLPDGWRGAAGIGGVRFFFVISGFLITWLLLREQSSTGRINLKAFYLRRAFRILPVYLAFLGICAVLSPYTRVNPDSGQWFATLFFGANYADLPGHFGHLWTLAVEEQFYLVWPLAFALSIGTGKYGDLRAGLLFACVLGPVCRAISFLTLPDPPLALNRFSFFLHLDSLAIGCLAAVLAWQRSEVWNLAVKWRWRLALAALFAIVAATPLASGFNGAVFFRYVGGGSLQALGFAVLLLLSLSRDEGLVHRCLNLRWAATLGVLSYSIYIWHLLFAPEHTEITFLLSLDDTVRKSIYLPLSLLAALFSYHGLEKPFLGLRRKYLTHD